MYYDEEFGCNVYCFNLYDGDVKYYLAADDLRKVLKKESVSAIDAICNDKIWSMTEKFLKDNDYDNFSFFSAVEVAKKIVEREIDSIIKK